MMLCGSGLLVVFVGVLTLAVGACGVAADTEAPILPNDTVAAPEPAESSAGGRGAYIAEDVDTHVGGDPLNQACAGSFVIDAEDTAGDVAAAGACVEIGGSLAVEATGLESLLGLESVTEVGESLYIGSNSGLNVLTGLEGLRRVGGDLTITNNPRLESLTGLAGLASVGSELSIRDNASLPPSDAESLEALVGVVCDCRGNVGAKAYDPCNPSTCGDGIRCDDEACDDGANGNPCDDCLDNCEVVWEYRCGDGYVCFGEWCDDGFNDACGSCNEDCTADGAGSVCGDDAQCPETEACDDGYTDDCGTCNADCSAEGTGSECGDGVPCPETEECDDGNEDNCDGCLDDCTKHKNTCGDGYMCDEEECDDGNNGDPCDGCLVGCIPHINFCGDGYKCGTEACDDGYNDDCGRCNINCTAEGSGLGTCGDGVHCAEAGESCDDGYTDACGSCNADCNGPGTGPGFCGDGVPCREIGEVCDDGFNDACGTCNINCTAAGSGANCGDGVVCPELEDCDDGNVVDDINGCDEQCQRYGFCGDGVREAWFEECDDGDSVDNGNGCGANCIRYDECGNDAAESWFETCDDGNTIPGDGCTGWCSEDTGCGDTTCNSSGPRFPVSREPQLSRTGGAEPVVVDALTGLMWQGCSAGLSGFACSTGDAATMAWAAAVSYCINLVWNGLDDWCLPDEYELQSIVDYRYYDPAIDSHAFPATPASWFWTSSSYAGITSFAWSVYFVYGSVGGYGKDGSYHVRCVRGGP